MKELFNTVFYQPLYNALAFLIDIVPGGDIGLAIIILTILVKVIILPLSNKALVSQAKMKELEPEIHKIKEKYKGKQEEIAKKTMALYKEKGVHPFSGCLPLFIQMPVVMALYFVFMKGGQHIDPTQLYSFVSAPDKSNLLFLGLIDLSKKSLIIAVVAGIAQYTHTKISMPAPAPRGGSDKASFSDEFARSMHMQMRYVFPVMMAVFAYAISGVVGLYLATSSTFSVVHELFFRKTKKIS